MRPDYMHIAHTWTERKIKTEQDFDAVLDNYRILFAYHSNAIEDACTVFAGTDGKNMDTDQTDQDEGNNTDDLPVTYKVL